MNSVRASAPQLADITPYDPKYLPARAYLSANENPRDVDTEIRQKIISAIRKVPLNRYPDPLANGLRDLIAEANGLDRDNVIVGNGGDELLFNIALAYGGPGRTMLNIPPTFSVYAYNAMLTRTNVVDIPRLPDFSIDEDAVVQRVAHGHSRRVVLGAEIALGREALIRPVDFFFYLPEDVVLDKLIDRLGRTCAHIITVLVWCTPIGLYQFRE